MTKMKAMTKRTLGKSLITAWILCGMLFLVFLALEKWQPMVICAVLFAGGLFVQLIAMVWD